LCLNCGEFYTGPRARVWKVGIPLQRSALQCDDGPGNITPSACGHGEGRP
jgi:hypothetical protein